MNDREEQIVDSALAWQQAITRDDMDWAALTDWLEADPRHRDAFDEVALIDAAVDTHRGTVRTLLNDQADIAQDLGPPATDRARSNGRRWFLGTGVAAALAVAIGLPLIQSQQAQSIAYATGPGATRSVALDDGSRLDLSADTRISVGAHQRRMTLARGAAYFDVRHDPSRQMVVDAGGYHITDIGTRFSVEMAGSRVAIAVAQGSVTVTPPVGDAVRLDAGDALTGDGGAAPVVSSVKPDSVAAWRGGRLAYDNAPLAKVASDISRYTGKRIDLAATLGDRRFSGVLVIGDGSHLVSDLAAVAGLAVHRGGGRIVLAADGR
ncbi:MAG: FecR family protein [Sphingomonas sp.]